MYAKCKKMMKNVVKACYYGLKKYINLIKILNSSEYKKLKKNRDKKRIILLDTPEHGNLGDQAIVWAEISFIKTYFPNILLCEFTQQEYILIKNRMEQYIAKEDVILVHGGGFIGTLWQNEEDVFLQILNQFKENKMVVFPQTVYFENSDYGHDEKEKLKKTLRECAHVKILLRDELSYKIMTNDLDMAKDRCFLVPDIVTWMNLSLKGSRTNRVLFCFRSDKEKLYTANKIPRIQNYLEKKGMECLFTDTVIFQKIKKENRRQHVMEKLKEFSQSKLVITDRLHGMIFAAITGTPCIAMDNVSKKVSGAYERWLNHLDYIKCIREDELEYEILEELLAKRVSSYSNKELETYYRIICDEIGAYLYDE